MKTQKEIIENDNLIASLILPDYKVELFLTYLGGQYVQYDMFYNGNLLFSGSDFRPAPSRDQDHIESAIDCLAFLCVQKGDTDPEYFKNYTSDQSSWSESYDCELLSGMISDFESSEPEYKNASVEFFTERFKNTLSLDLHQ
jgi:hypothetical protein